MRYSLVAILGVIGLLGLLAPQLSAWLVTEQIGNGLTVKNYQVIAFLGGTLLHFLTVIGFILMDFVWLKRTTNHHSRLHIVKRVSLMIGLLVVTLLGGLREIVPYFLAVALHLFMWFVIGFTLYKERQARENDAKS